ncbi:MAG: hypothetical protein [Caudoviricetes sp.]|nr:MAG: hypothetical protein [Caudoviricetes sp.]
MDKEQNVTIFFKNGTTARFEQVTDFRAYGRKLEFKFLSVSDGVTKSAVFDHAHIAGITIGEKVERVKSLYQLRSEGSDATEGSND